MVCILLLRKVIYAGLSEKDTREVDIYDLTNEVVDSFTQKRKKCYWLVVIQIAGYIDT